MKKLADSQVEAFDTVYVEGARWDTVRARIDHDFPRGDFRFLDIGGGNGTFADLLLETYPNASGTVLDNSEVLLARNKHSERKTLIRDSVENLRGIRERFDLVCIHWLLHHLVGDSYRRTHRNQVETLGSLSAILTERGRISVFENMCNGWVVDNLPGRMIYAITSARSIASIARKLGANTAGVGVCFLSSNAWHSTLREAALEILGYSEPDDWVWPLPTTWRALLHIRDMRVGHFWLRVLGAHD